MRREWEGRGGGQSCASVQAAREEREKERGEQDVMSTAMDESTLDWEKAEERATQRKTDEA